LTESLSIFILKDILVLQIQILVLFFLWFACRDGRGFGRARNGERRCSAQGGSRRGRCGGGNR
jgi:hypothetical protein